MGGLVNFIKFVNKISSNLISVENTIFIILLNFCNPGPPSSNKSSKMEKFGVAISFLQPQLPRLLLPLDFLQKLALPLMLGGPYIARSIQVTEGGSFQVLHLLSKIRLILLICPQIQCNNNAHENPNLIFILLALAFDSAIKNNIRTFLPRQCLQSFNCRCSTSTPKIPS